MDLSTISQKIREARNNYGYSQEKLSELSGISLRTIQRIENGETTPRVDTLTRLFEILDIQREEIKEVHRKDKNYIMLLLLSSLSFILFPLLGIVVPLIFWISKKDIIQDINVVAKRLLNFEITWFLIFIALFYYTITFFDIGDDITPTSVAKLAKLRLWILGIAYLYNICFIVFNTIRVDKGKKTYYFPAFPFMR